MKGGDNMLKDYVDLLKHSFKFVKKHWLGTIMIYIIIWVLTAIYILKEFGYTLEDLKEYLNVLNYFKRKEN